MSDSQPVDMIVGVAARGLQTSPSSFLALRSCLSLLPESVGARRELATHSSVLWHATTACVQRPPALGISLPTGRSYS